jgi:hypothetical protein
VTGETWRPVVGWENHYSVSDHGRVRREQPGPHTYVGRLLRPSRTKRGYLAVRLCCPGSVEEKRVSPYVHRLVLAAFRGTCPEGYEANHIDADRANNDLSNLEYVTKSQNTRHMYVLGRRCLRGENGPNAHLTTAAARTIRRLRGVVLGKDLAARFGVSPSQVSNIQLGRAWQEV